MAHFQEPFSGFPSKENALILSSLAVVKDSLMDPNMIRNQLQTAIN